MMNRFQQPFALAAMLFVSGSPTSASEPQALAHNPFSRPPSEVAIDVSAPIVIAEGSTTAPDLRATMVTIGSRLANVAGIILQPGDEIQGFRLLHVYEDRAVFESQGRQQTVYVKPDPAEDEGIER